MIKIGVLAVALLAGLLVAERLLPLRSRYAGFFGRLAVNLTMAAVAYAVSGSTVTPLAMRLVGGPWGLLSFPAIPAAARLVLGLLLMDLSFYYWHRLNHRLPLLWRFHNVHHLDPDLDVTTAVRFHFGEILLSTMFRAAQITALGITLPVYAAYEACLQCANLFHHSNVRLPIAVERALNLIIVTPRMHGIHHSEIEGEANSNYSVVFSFWDRLHRSLCLGVPQADVRVGVPAYREPGDNRLLRALAHPFRRQRDYWVGPDGKRPRRESPAGPRSRLLD